MAIRFGGYTLVQPEGHTRRRLLFIDRQYDPIAEEIQIAAGTIIVISEPNKQKTLEWHPNTTIFIGQWYIGMINGIELKKPNGPHVAPFRAFQVIISSLLCIGSMEPEIEKKIGRLECLNEQPKEYFERFLHKQIGSHIFVGISGKICHINTYIERKNYMVSSIAVITSIYPCIRYARHEDPPRQQLVFGLRFEYFGNNWNTGNRYYHRKDFDKVEAGGVNEITLEQLNNLQNGMVSQQNQRYFGLFVCVGAKLFVVDNCTKEPARARHTDVPHNRSLIQQGGMVFIESEQLVFTENARYPDNKREDNPYTRYRNNFFDRMVPVFGDPNDTTLTNRYRRFKNPIIFLGAIDSAFNTIAWRLNVNYKKDRHLPGVQYKAKYELFIPEEGRIVAIADGLDGIKEIQQRVYYEMLHDSVLTEHGTQFRIFDPNIIRDILNLNDRRSLDQIYEFIKTPTEKRYKPKRKPYIPLFREFNFRTLIEYNKEYNYQTRNKRLPVPPMYPPIEIEDQVIYLPNRDMREPVENSYPKKEAINPSSINPYKQLYRFKRDVQKDTISCKIMEGRIPDYDWFRLDSNIPLADVDGINKRIGVDGWVWEKCESSDIFTFKSIGYCLSTDHLPVPNPPGTKPPEGGPSGSGKSGHRRSQGSQGRGQSSEGRRRRQSGGQSPRKKRKH